MKILITSTYSIIMNSDQFFFLLFYSALFRLCKNAFVIVSDRFWGPNLSKYFQGARPLTPRPRALPLDLAAPQTPGYGGLRHLTPC